MDLVEHMGNLSKVAMVETSLTMDSSRDTNLHHSRTTDKDLQAVFLDSSIIGDLMKDDMVNRRLEWDMTFHLDQYPAEEFVHAL